MRRSTLIPKTHLPLLLRSPFSSSSSSNGSHHSTLLNLPPIQELDPHHFTPRKAHFESIKLDAQRIFHILRQDGPGFNFQSALDELSLTLSTDLARQVLILILCSVNAANKPRTARLAYKFFVWAGQCPDYKHTANTYNLTLKIFAETDELKAMWRLVDDMTECGIPITALTFNILICACGEAGMARKVVERFLKSKDFNYRPFKHSFNAILYSLLTVNQFRLVEWVYQKMVLEGYLPDLLTYNVVMRAKYRLGKLEEFQRVMDEMGNNGFVPDRHTYNLLLHVLGKADKFQAANELLDYMDRVGCSPSVLHFTTLIDGFSRAGNLDACRHFFDMMGKKGCEPDVVSYTVLITGYVLAGEFEKAHVLFDDMLVKGQLPNVYTYNSIIRGLCVMGKFDEACELLKSMDSRGCVPNFSVYSTLVRRLRNAGKSGQAHEIISYMVEKGHYLHLLFKFKGLDAAVLDLVADDGAGLQKQKSVYHWDKKSKKYIKLNNGERVTASGKIKTESGAKVKASKTGIYKKWKERSHKRISLDGSKDTKEDGTAHGGGRQIRGGNKWQLKGGRNRRSIPNANVPSELRDPEQVRKDRQQKATKIAQFKNKLSSKKGNNKFGKDKGNSKFGKDKGNNKFGKNKGQKKSKGRF